MVVVDVTDVDEAGNYVPLPTGEYPSKIIEVEENNTNAGDPMWSLKFEVLEGDCKGRHFFDNLVFSDNPKTRQRLKLVLKRLGYDVGKAIDVTPASMIGRAARITVMPNEYTDNDGVLKKTNKVAFAGYDYLDDTGKSSAPKTPSAGAGEDDELPF